jgi:hypothetical protein
MFLALESACKVELGTCTNMLGRFLWYRLLGVTEGAGMLCEEDGPTMLVMFVCAGCAVSA